MDLTREEMAAVIREEMARVSPIPMDAEETMRRISERVARSRADDVNERIEQARMSGTGNGSKPRVDWTLNLPTMLTMLSLGGTLAVGLIGWVNTIDRRVSAVEQSILIANERATRYVPRIEAAELKNELQDSQNKVQEERIQNLAVGLQEVRKVNGEVMTVLGNIREDLAVIRERLQISRPQRQSENKR